MPLPCFSKTAPEPKKKAASPFHAVLNLVNSVIGAGVLGIPFAFAKAGLVPAIIIFIMMTALNYISLAILCYISDATLVYSYGDLAGRIFGPPFVIFVGITTFFHCFGLLWAYVVLSGDFLSSFLRAVGISADSFVQDRWFVTVIVSVFVLWPLSWFRRVESLSAVSSIAIFCILYALLVIFIRMITRLAKDEVDDGPEAVHASMSLVQCFSTLCFAFACQQNAPIIQGELKYKSAPTMRKVALASMIICGILYFVAGFCGYIQFTTEFFDADNAGNILNMYGDKDYLALSARLGALFVVICSYPLLLIPARGAIFNVLRAIQDIHTYYKEKAQEEETAHKNNTMPPQRLPLTRIYAQLERAPPFIPPEWKQIPVFGGRLTKHHLATAAGGTVIVTITMLLSIWLNNVAFVFDIIGSTATALVCFIIPPIIYIRVRMDTKTYVNPNRKEVLEDLPILKSQPSSQTEEHRGRVISTQMATIDESKQEDLPPQLTAATQSGEAATTEPAVPAGGISTAESPSALPLLAAGSPSLVESESATPTQTDVVATSADGTVTLATHPGSAPPDDTTIDASSSDPDSRDAIYAEELRQLMIPKKLTDPPIIGAIVVIVLGSLFGLLSLALAIIYDTDIHNKYNIK